MNTSELLLAELPTPTEDSQPFWDGCNRQELLLQHCAGCGHVFYYARRLCPSCGSTQLSWQAARGRGTVYSFSQIHVPFQGPHWQSQLPYCVVLIDLQEGPRLLSRWLAPKAQVPEIGQSALVAFVKVGQQHLPFFGPDRQERPRQAPGLESPALIITVHEYRPTAPHPSCGLDRGAAS